MGSRLKVRHQVLALAIWVQFLAPQPVRTIRPFDQHIEGFFVGKMQATVSKIHAL